VDDVTERVNCNSHVHVIKQLVRNTQEIKY